MKNMATDMMTAKEAKQHEDHATVAGCAARALVAAHTALVVELVNMMDRMAEAQDFYDAHGVELSQATALEAERGVKALTRILNFMNGKPVNGKGSELGQEVDLDRILAGLDHTPKNVGRGESNG